MKNVNLKAKLYIEATLLIIFGILMCIAGKGTLKVILIIFGSVLIVAGIASMANKIPLGLLPILLGILLIVGAVCFIENVLLIFGICTTISAILGIIAYCFKKSDNLVGSCVSLVMGGLLIAAKWGNNLYFYITGGVWILLGVVGIILVSIKYRVKTVDVKPSDKDKDVVDVKSEDK